MKINFKMWCLVSAFLLFLASTVAGTATFFLIYQPKEPKCIKKVY